MKGIEYRYRTGRAIPSSEWNHDLPFFGRVVYPDWQKERATAQLDLKKEIHWKKVTSQVILSEGEEHLLRPSNQEELKQVRKELDSLNLIASQTNIYART